MPLTYHSFNMPASQLSPLDIQPLTTNLETLIRGHLDLLSASASQVMAPHASISHLDPMLVYDLGEYLVSAARVWSQLTEKLVDSIQIEKLALEAHENAMMENHLSDMSAIVLIDVEAARLKRIQELSAKFCDEVEKIWVTGGNSHKP